MVANYGARLILSLSIPDLSTVDPEQTKTIVGCPPA